MTNKLPPLPVIIVALMLSSCARHPLTENEIRAYSQECAKRGGTPEVRYAHQGVYGPDYSYPLEVFCIGAK